MRRLILVASLMLVGCVTSENEAINTARRAGFIEIVPKGLDFFACSDDDKTGREFTGTNATGERVTGTVCCGVIKNCTIRY